MASTESRVAELRLRLRTERQSIETAKQQLNSLTKEFTDFKSDVERSNTALEQQARAIQQQQIAAQKSTQGLRNFASQERQLQQEARNTARALKDQAEASERASRFSLRSIGRAARVNLPAVPIGGGLSSEQVARAVEGIGFAEEALGRLGATGKIAAAGIGIAIVAITAQLIGLKKRNDEAKTAAEAALAAQGRYLELVKTGSKESLEAALKDAQVQQQIAQDRADFFNAVLTGLEQAVDAGGAFSRVTAEAGAALNGILGTQPELVATRESAKQAGDALVNATAEVYALQRAVNSAEVATRDAAEAEKKLAEERQKIADQRIQTELQTNLEITKLSSQSIQQRLDDLNRENMLIFGIARAGEASDELLGKLTARSRDIATIVPLLQQALPVAQARERVEALADAIKNIPNTAKDAIDSLKRIQDAARKLTEVGQQHSDKLAQIEADRTDKIAEAELDRNNAILEARRDADIAIAEAERKAGQDRVEIERQSQQNIAKILRRAKFDEANAIQDRDAVALDQARRRKEQELADEKANAEERQKQLDDNLKEQLRTIRLRLGEQLRTIDLRYQDQVRLANKAAQKSIAQEQARYTKELADAQRAYAEILKVELAKHQQTISLAQSGAGAVLSVTATMWQTLVNQARTAASAVQQRPANVTPIRPTPTTPTPYVPPGTRVPTLASGGYVNRDGMAYLHAGEYVVNPRRGQRGFTFAPVINGTSKSQIKRLVNRELDVFLEDMFA